MRVEHAIFDAIEEHDDEGDGCGAPIGEVIETVLEETDCGLNILTVDLNDLYVHGEIYQPNPTSVKRVHPRHDENEEVEKA